MSDFGPSGIFDEEMFIDEWKGMSQEQRIETWKNTSNDMRVKIINYLKQSLHFDIKYELGNEAEYRDLIIEFENIGSEIAAPALVQWNNLENRESRLMFWKELGYLEKKEVWTTLEKTNLESFNELWDIEWSLAEDYFSKDENKNKEKMKRADGNTLHSYLKIGDRIFIKGRRDEILGEGAYGVVKPSVMRNGKIDVTNKHGDQLIIKRQLITDPDNQHVESSVTNEKVALTKLDELSGGVIIRRVKSDKTIDGNPIVKKAYIVAKRHEGKDLYKIIKNNKKNGTKFSELEKAKLAYQIIDKFQIGQSHGLRHGDIKPEQIIVHQEGDKFKVAVIDWGYSEVMGPDGKHNSKHILGGTPGYIPPELLLDGTASFKSDVFSLGVMFKNNLALPSDIYSSMMFYDENRRPDLTEVMDRMVHHLNELPEIERDEEVRNIINNYNLQKLVYKLIEYKEQLPATEQTPEVLQEIDNVHKMIEFLQQDNTLDKSEKEKKFADYLRENNNENIKSIKQNLTKDLEQYIEIRLDHLPASTTIPEKSILVEDQFQNALEERLKEIKLEFVLDKNREVDEIYLLCGLTDTIRSQVSIIMQGKESSEEKLEKALDFLQGEIYLDIKIKLNDFVKDQIALIKPKEPEKLPKEINIAEIYNELRLYSDELGNPDDIEEMISMLQWNTQLKGESAINAVAESLLEIKTADHGIISRINEIMKAGGYVGSDVTSEKSKVEMTKAKFDEPSKHPAVSTQIIDVDKIQKDLEEYYMEIEEHSDAIQVDDMKDIIRFNKDSSVYKENKTKLIAEALTEIKSNDPKIKAKVNEILRTGGYIADDLNKISPVTARTKPDKVQQPSESPDRVIFNNFMNELTEMNKESADENIQLFIEDLKYNISTPYFAKNPLQCIESVISENIENILKIKNLEKLQKKLFVMNISIPQLDEEIKNKMESLQHEMDLQRKEAEDKTVALQHADTYIYYLIKQTKAVPGITQSQIDQFNQIEKIIKYQNRIAGDNPEILLKNTLSILSKREDEFQDIQNTISTILENVGEHFDVDMQTLKVKVEEESKKFEQISAAIVEEPDRRQHVESVLIDLSQLMQLFSVEDSVLKEMNIANLIVDAVASEIKQEDSQDLRVKIQSFSNERTKLSLIKDYLSKLNRDYLDKLNDIEIKVDTESFNRRNNSVNVIMNNLYKEWNINELPKVDIFAQDDKKQVNVVEPSDKSLFSVARELIIAYQLDKPVGLDKLAIESRTESINNLLVLLRQKTDRYHEGIIKDPQEALANILHDAQADPHLNSIVNKVANELNISLENVGKLKQAQKMKLQGIEVGMTDEQIAENAKKLEEFKAKARERSEQIAAIKKEWQEKATSLLKLAPPQKDSYQDFTQKMLDDSINRVKLIYQDAPESEKKLLHTNVIPSLEKAFFERKSEVLKGYLVTQQEQKRVLQAEHAIIKDKENEAAHTKSQLRDKINENDEKEAKLQTDIIAHHQRFEDAQKGKLGLPTQENPQVTPVKPRLSPVVASNTEALNLKDASIFIQQAERLKKTEQVKYIPADVFEEIKAQRGKPSKASRASEVNLRERKQNELEILLKSVEKAENELKAESEALENGYHVILAYESTSKLLKAANLIVTKQNEVVELQEQRLDVLTQAIPIEITRNKVKTAFEQEENSLLSQIDQVNGEWRAEKATIQLHIDKNLAPISLNFTEEPIITEEELALARKNALAGLPFVANASVDQPHLSVTTIPSATPDVVVGTVKPEVIPGSMKAMPPPPPPIPPPDLKQWQAKNKAKVTTTSTASESSMQSTVQKKTANVQKTSSGLIEELENQIAAIKAKQDESDKQEELKQKQIAQEQDAERFQKAVHLIDLHRNGFSLNDEDNKIISKWKESVVKINSIKEALQALPPPDPQTLNENAIGEQENQKQTIATLNDKLEATKKSKDQSLLEMNAQLIAARAQRKEYLEKLKEIKQIYSQILEIEIQGIAQSERLQIELQELQSKISLKQEEIDPELYEQFINQQIEQKVSEFESNYKPFDESAVYSFSEIDKLLEQKKAERDARVEAISENSLSLNMNIISATDEFEDKQKKLKQMKAVYDEIQRIQLEQIQEVETMKLHTQAKDSLLSLAPELAYPKPSKEVIEAHIKNKIKEYKKDNPPFDESKAYQLSTIDAELEKLKQKRDLAQEQKKKAVFDAAQQSELARIKRAQSIRSLQEFNLILETDFEKKYNEAKNKSGAINYFKQGGKEVFAHVSGTANVRKAQMRKLSAEFKNISDSKTEDISAIRANIVQARQALEDIKEEISNESSAYKTMKKQITGEPISIDSKLYDICDDKIKELNTIMNELNKWEPLPEDLHKVELTVPPKPLTMNDKQFIAYQDALRDKINQLLKQHGQTQQFESNKGYIKFIEQNIEKEMNYIYYFARANGVSLEAKIAALKLQSSIESQPDYQKYVKNSITKKEAPKSHQVPTENRVGAIVTQQNVYNRDRKGEGLKGDLSKTMEEDTKNRFNPKK